MTISAEDALHLVGQTHGMNAEETTQVLSLLVSATLEVEQGALLLRSWAARGETGTELASTVSFLRAHAVSVPVSAPCFDLCGTGGSGLCRYNVSTTVAFVAAAAGVPVAKHGNRGSHRPNGSFDLLEALGVPFSLSPAQEAALVAETNVCFIFARSHHPAVGKVVPYRQAAARRSIFNLAGPLANPVAIKHQIIGTVNESTAQIVAEALATLGTAGALVVWGEPGIDEISVTGTTGYLHVAGSARAEGVFKTPAHPGLDYAQLPGGDAKENAETFLALLSGRETGPLLDMVCVNAGAAIDLWTGAPPTYSGEGAALARSLIKEGQVLATFEKHRTLAQRLSPG